MASKKIFISCFRSTLNRRAADKTDVPVCEEVIHKSLIFIQFFGDYCSIKHEDEEESNGIIYKNMCEF